MNKDYELCYESDASGLKGRVERVFFPGSIERVCEIIKSSGRFDIVPRGFGTGLVGGSVPKNSVVIDMRKMNKVGKFNGKERSVIAEAGVSVKELNEKLRAVGYEFPISSFNDGSIGGMIALNKISDRSMRYGSVKDWIEEMKIVNGRGEIVKIGKTDLMDVCSMEGITGVIVSAKLKVIPLVRGSISIFQSDEIEEIMSIAKRLKLEKEIIMLKFYSPEVSKMLGFPEKYNLIIEFNLGRGKIKGGEYDRILNIKNKERFYFYSNGYFDSLDSLLFFDKIEEFVRFLEGNNIPYSGDLGLGIICPYFRDNEDEKKERVFNFLKNTKVRFVKYGFGLKRKDLVESGERRIIQRVKMRHDPFVKMNRGKIIDGIRDNEKKVEPISDGIKTAEKIVEEIKSPDSELNNFIKSVKVQEDVKKVLDKSGINGQIRDYEKTFNSELVEGKKQKIERFANDVPHEIVKKERESFNYSEIKDLMKDKFGFSGSVNTIDREDEDGN